jgi:hypothetical protein
MTDDDLATLLPDLAHVTLELGDVLHEAGQPIEVVYFPIRGVVSGQRPENLTRLATLRFDLEPFVGAGHALSLQGNILLIYEARTSRHE